MSTLRYLFTRMLQGVRRGSTARCLKCGVTWSGMTEQRAAELLSRHSVFEHDTEPDWEHADVREA